MIDELRKLVYTGIKQKEEELLLTVLREYLKREPIEDDFRKCTMYKYPHVDLLNYEFAYNDIKLGKVVFNFDDPCKVLITFNPS